MHISENYYDDDLRASEAKESIINSAECSGHRLSLILLLIFIRFCKFRGGRANVIAKTFKLNSVLSWSLMYCKYTSQSMCDDWI